jgi:hypothetical protein
VCDGVCSAVFLAHRIQSADQITRNGNVRVRPRLYKDEPKRALKVIDMRKKKGNQVCACSSALVSFDL